MCFMQAAVDMHVCREQVSPILTWERCPIGHEDQLVSDGFGSGVVVHMLFKDKENRATRWGQGHFGSHCPDLLVPGLHFCF